MKPTKFRVWDGKDMYDVKSINFADDYPGGFICVTVADGDSVKTLFQAYSDDMLHIEGHYKLDLLQYTGLNDEKGNKIYTGDIVRKTIDNPNNFPYKKEFNIKNDQFVGRVIYQDGMYFIEDYEGTAGLELFSETDTNEVLGNIYENKDDFAFKW